jgi:site-specific DNA-methyltransferase (adenine-specific)
MAAMADADPESIDAIVCDPPYGLRFMGKAFDDLGDGALQREWHVQWLRQAIRVLKPGGVIKAFGGTRTFHHMAAAMEDVGFVLVPGSELEAWTYGSGFPKSQNVEKVLRKQGSDRADDFRGVGTALKPAWEPVLVARKPGPGLDLTVTGTAPMSDR